MRIEHATERLLDQDGLAPEVVLDETPVDDAIEPLEVEVVAAAPAAAAAADTSDVDLLNLYLEETTREALLTREQEVDLAQSIEDAEHGRAVTALTSPLGLRFLRSLADDIRTNQLGAADVCGDASDDGTPLSNPVWFRRRFTAQVGRVVRLAGELAALPRPRARGACSESV